jgi:hypothetical protein
MEPVQAEELRLSYKPDKVRLLFVDESRPAGTTFFYRANSNLYRYTRQAFSNVFQFGDDPQFSFLAFFKRLGCYLDDLCLRPANKMRNAS